jgi:hypothetical protein
MRPGFVVGLAILALLPLASAVAEEIKPPDLSTPDSWQPRLAGTFRIMNKIDSTVQAVTIGVGAQVRFQSLTLKLTGCFVRPPDLPADAAAHLTITDTRDGAPDFDGWMLKKEPALNMLEHPVYDVQLASCG